MLLFLHSGNNNFFLYFYFRSPNSDLRRRKRQDARSAMEDKVREIKRKQKMCEDKANSSPKKRRSLMISIAAGVVVIGVICIYAYTKLG